MELRVWKELAVSKQVLMLAATEALKLDKDCTPEELKVALDAAIKRSADADVNISNAQEEARLSVAAVEQVLSKTKKTLESVEAELAETKAKQEKLELQLGTDRTNHAQQMQKIKDSLAEKERAIKTISTTLSDTPENVVKKLKTLKKQKMDEADARKKADAALATLRKEKKQLEQEKKEIEQELKELKDAQEKPEEEAAA
ncbi:hypothetical protein BOW53_09785 [Solemya pervernicosa gill symbiont]|uniref:Uncharacterized protein n=2 Tax=Gammaproteobacteria incertae sedis TaxID=118884 RepID=A0A1T2L4M9_9GAMM|nr:hypothetical protein BOW53_09785 [Solemya pervernicosa gill symbiont]